MEASKSCNELSVVNCMLKPKLFNRLTISCKVNSFWLYIWYTLYLLSFCRIDTIKLAHSSTGLILNVLSFNSRGIFFAFIINCIKLKNKFSSKLCWNIPS